MTQTAQINFEKIQQWMERKSDADSIRRELDSLGYNPDLIEAHLKEYRKLKDSKKQNAGFILLVAGAVLGFISCVLTILNVVPSLHDFFLYGLTSISVIVLCVGLYLVFE